MAKLPVLLRETPTVTLLSVVGALGGAWRGATEGKTKGKRKVGAVLQRSIAKKRAGQAGFTLVELLVVIVILGILAAIVVFAIGGITDKGQSASCKADKSTLEAAEEAYFAQHSAYTDNMQDLVDGGFIHEVSTLHTVATVPAGGGAVANYTVNGVSGKCA
jgi:general secretion pathway protein G